MALGAARKHAAEALDVILDIEQLAKAAELMIEVFLTPGVLVAPGVTALIDADGDGLFSQLEASAYAARMLRDVSLIVDGHAIELNATAVQLPEPTLMRDGGGRFRRRAVYQRIGLAAQAWALIAVSNAARNIGRHVFRRRFMLAGREETAIFFVHAARSKGADIAANASS